MNTIKYVIYTFKHQRRNAVRKQWLITRYSIHNSSGHLNQKEFPPLSSRTSKASIKAFGPHPPLTYIDTSSWRSVEVNLKWKGNLNQPRIWKWEMVSFYTMNNSLDTKTIDNRSHKLLDTKKKILLNGMLVCCLLHYLLCCQMMSD